jgi:CAAX protease family protein
LAQLSKSRGFPRVLFVLCTVFVAPPLEEFVFRGMAFAAVARSFGTLAAIIITTAVFVFMHCADKIHYWPGFVMVACLGLAACWLRLHYRSLWPGIFLHCSYNALVLLL